MYKYLPIYLYIYLSMYIYIYIYMHPPRPTHGNPFKYKRETSNPHGVSKSIVVGANTSSITS